MIIFGMKTALVRFQDKYYNYKGVVWNDMEDGSKDDNGLAIEAFEAALCVDTGATFVYEMCENIIGKLKYAGTYQDDGLTIFDGQKTVQEAIEWVCDFQLQVNEVVGGTFFQFTAEVWNPLEMKKLPTCSI
eukprot:11667055-Ditylum_brightwellii.AAC.1